MKTWDYAHWLPYFKKMENCLAWGDEFHGDRGPLILERGPATNHCSRPSFRRSSRADTRSRPDVNRYGRRACCL